MTLPDQMSTAEMERLLGRYQERIDDLPVIDDPRGPHPSGVYGGTVNRSAHHWREITPNHRLRLERGDNGRYPIVRIDYAWDRLEPRSVCQVETSKARLLQIGEHEIENARFASPTTQHTVPIEATRREVQLYFQVFTDPFVAGPLVKGSAPTSTTTYTIPAAATHILGSGTVRYFSGQTEPVRSDVPERLLRPGLSGDLTIREGGVYAEFIGTEPAQVKVGGTWIETPEA